MKRIDGGLSRSGSNEKPKMAIIDFVNCRDDNQRQLLFTQARSRMSRAIDRLLLNKNQEKITKLENNFYPNGSIVAK